MYCDIHLYGVYIYIYVVACNDVLSCGLFIRSSALTNVRYVPKKGESKILLKFVRCSVKCTSTANLHLHSVSSKDFE